MALAYGNSGLRDQVISILNASQENLANHPSCISQITKLCQQEGTQQVLVDTFLPLIQNMLAVYKREHCVENSAKFIVSLAVTHEDLAVRKKPFFSILLEYLLPLTRLSSRSDSASLAKAVRFRSTQLICMTLNTLSEDAEISEGLWNNIETHLIERTFDKLPLIRAQACVGLARLQDTEDPKSRITQRFLRLIKSDPCKDVRKAALSNIVICPLTLKEVIIRSHDISPDVRKATFEIIASHVPISFLSTSQRIALLQNGLYDRETSVHSSCSDMCIAWLQRKNLSIPSLLSYLDVNRTNPELIDLLLGELFQRVPLEPADVHLKHRPPNLEEAILWRNYCQYLYSLQDIQRLELALPENLDFVDLVNDHLSKVPSTLILRQLFLMASMLDISDESSRLAIQRMLRKMIVSRDVDESLIEPISNALRRFSITTSNFIEILFDAISELYKILYVYFSPETKAKSQEREDKKALIISQVNLMNMDISISDGSETNKMLQEQKSSLKEMELELQVLLDQIVIEEGLEYWSSIRLLALCEQILCHFTVDNNDIAKHEFILKKYLYPTMECRFKDVRAMALKCIGIFFSLRIEKRSSYYEPFIHAIEHDEEPVRQMAVKVIFDLISLHGIPDTIPHLVPMLRSHLAVNSSLKSVTAEGFTKLFVANRLRDPHIIADMMILLFDPRNVKNDEIQHLSLFFPMLAFASYNNQRLILDSFLRVSREVLCAPTSSTLSAVHVPTLFQFYIHLTSSEKIRSMHLDAVNKSHILVNAIHLHNHLATLVCLEILGYCRLDAEPGRTSEIRNRFSKSVRQLCKLLACLDISMTDSQDALSQLVFLLRKTLTAVSNHKVNTKLVQTILFFVESMHAGETQQPCSSNRGVPIDLQFVSSQELNWEALIEETTADQAQFINTLYDLSTFCNVKAVGHTTTSYITTGSSVSAFGSTLGNSLPKINNTTTRITTPLSNDFVAIDTPPNTTEVDKLCLNIHRFALSPSLSQGFPLQNQENNSNSACSIPNIADCFPSMKTSSKLVPSTKDLKRTNLPSKLVLKDSNQCIVHV